MSEQIKELESIVSELQTNLDIAKSELNELKSKGGEWPKTGDEYWCVWGDGTISSCCYSPAYTTDVLKLSQGNLFRTQEAAEARAKWNRLHAAMMRASDGFKEGKHNRYPVWCYSGGRPFTDLHIRCASNAPYFRTEEACQKAIDKILGDDTEFYLTYDGGYGS